MNKPDTQQITTSSLLGGRYQGTRFLQGTWAQRQNKEQGKDILSAVFPEAHPLPKAGRIMETTKNKGFKSADTGAGQGQVDPGLGPHSGISCSLDMPPAQTPPGPP